MISTAAVIVTTTLPNEAAAQAIAEAAVAARLAACAQVQGPITSTFRWQGQIDRATEWYCHLKTTRDSLSALEQLIRQHHPYDIPEIIAVPVVWGSEDYLAWVSDEARGTGKREEGRGKREEGRGKREEGRGKRAERIRAPRKGPG